MNIETELIEIMSDGKKKRVARYLIKQVIELLNIDCMEYMVTCKDKQFDLAIVDPPYGGGEHFNFSIWNR